MTDRKSKWRWLWTGDTWAEPDPNRTPVYHTFGEDIRDLCLWVVKCLVWVLGTLMALGLLVVALALSAWMFIELFAALRPVPVWAWLIVIPLFGIWHRLSAKER
jgi:hypothetical protein